MRELWGWKIVIPTYSEPVAVKEVGNTTYAQSTFNGRTRGVVFIGILIGK